MTLEQKITADIKSAMKEKRKNDLRGLRAIKQAIILAKTDGSGTEIDEAKEIAMLQKLVKQRKESLKIYQDQGRDDLAETEQQEITVIEQYLPQPVSEEELKAIVDEIIAETGASSMADMAKVMKAAQAKLAGRADGKTISQVVRERLK